MKMKYIGKANLAKGFEVLRFFKENKLDKIDKSNKSDKDFNLNLIGEKIGVKNNDKLSYYSPINNFKKHEFIDLFRTEVNNLDKLENENNVESDNQISNHHFTKENEYEYFLKEENIYFDSLNHNFIINNYIRLNERKDKDPNKSNVKIDKVKKIGFITESSGIIEAFRIIDSLYDDTYLNFLNKQIQKLKYKPAISLVSIFDNSNEICFADDLIKYHNSSKIFFHPIIKTPTDNVFSGKTLTINDINDYMPSCNDSNAIVFVSGNNDFYDYVDNIIKYTSFEEGKNLFYYL